MTAKLASNLRFAPALIAGLLSVFIGRAEAQDLTTAPTSTGQFFFNQQGGSPNYTTFVLPLDYQSGVQLAPKLKLPWPENQLPNVYPWALRTAASTRYLYVPGASPAPGSYSLETTNPLAVFGSSAGGNSMLLGRSYRFAFFAGAQTAATDVADEMMIYVYRKSDFNGSQTNVAPVASQPIDIPHWPSVAAGGSATGWQTFGNGGYQTTFTTSVSSVPVLETKIQFILSNNPADTFAITNGTPLLITHKGLSSDYCFVLGYKAMVSTGGTSTTPMAVSNLQSPQTSATHVLGYGFQFDADSPWITTLVKTPSFQGEPAPPTYYGKTAEEIAAITTRFDKQFAAPASAYTTVNNQPELQSHTILDKLVTDLGGDAMSIVNFVTNEIELSDALSYNENGDVDDVSVNSGGMNRGALGTYLEGQGSPEEQCALLVYLLRRSGAPAGFVRAPHNQMKMLDQQLSNLLRMRLKGATTPLNGQPVPKFIPVNYPWVAAYVNVDGQQKWVHIFPWLKDMEVVEGLSVEGVMPWKRNSNGDALTQHGSIRDWVRDFLLAGKTDHLMKNLDPENKTPGNIFLKDLDWSLRDKWQGLSRDDIGIRFRTRKLNRQKWTEFPQPAQFTAENQLPPNTSYQLTSNLAPDTSWYDTVSLEIASVNNSGTKMPPINGLRIMDLHNRRAVVNFKPVPGDANSFDMTFTMEPFDLSNPDAGLGDFTTTNDPYLRKKQVRTLRVKETVTPPALPDSKFSFKVTYRRPRAYLPPPLNNTVDPNILGGWSNFLGISHVENGQGAGESTDPTEANRTIIATSYFGLGDMNAFCLNTGRVTQRMLQPHLEKFWQHEQARAANTSTPADYELMKGTMSWIMGMSYYQRVSDSFEQLKNVFKVNFVSSRAHGFASLGALKGTNGKLVIAENQIEQVYPVVDMNFFRAAWAAYGDSRPDVGGQSAVSGVDFMTNLYITEISALESLTISKYFSEGDTDAVSTVAMIQKIQQDDNAATNVIELNSSNWSAIGAQSYTYTDNTVVPAVNETKTLEAWAGGQAAGSMWREITALFTAWDKDLARVYITPGAVKGANGQWKGMGALIMGRDKAAALIGRLNGGFGGFKVNLQQSVLSFEGIGVYDNYAKVTTIPNVHTVGVSNPISLQKLDQSIASYGGLITNYGTKNNATALVDFSSIVSNYVSDNFKGYHSSGTLTFNTSSFANTVSDILNSGSYLKQGVNTSVLNSFMTGDPVNSMTGEMYADDVDLTLPGPLPLQVRRNYGSQVLTQGNFGHGWKMAYFPYLFVNDNASKIHAAELDGSVIVYTRNAANVVEEEWIVSPDDNPNLTNGSGFNIGSVFNRYLNKLKRTVAPGPNGKTTYTLTGGDGTIREYEVKSFQLLGTTIQRTRPYLKRITDANGNFLDFIFNGDTAGDDPSTSSYGELAKVKASNGNSLGFRYDTYGRIVEAYTQDGRHVYYTYDDEGDLREVRLPDNSWAKYEYLHEKTKVGTTNNDAWYSTHLLNREIRPDGRMVESDYQLYVAGDTDETGAVIPAAKVGKASHLRRVLEQRATVGKHRAGDGRDKPAQESYAPVRNVTYIYNQTKDAAGHITGNTQIKDAYNRITTYYYVNNHLTRTVDPMAMETSQEWYTKADVTALVPGAFEGAAKAMVDKRGLRTEFKYTTSGDLEEITTIGDLDGDGTATAGEKAVTFIQYNALHLPILVIRPNSITGLANGPRTRYTYGDATRPYMVTLVEELTADGVTVVTSSSMLYHDAFTIANDLTKPFSKGLLQESKRAVGTTDEAVATWEHEPRGFATTQTAATGTADPQVKTGYSYNLRGELVEERVLEGNVAKKINRYAYDDMGRRIWEERLDENRTQLAWNYVYYNLNGEVEWTDGSKSNPEDYTYTRYDGAGRPVEKVGWRSEANANGTGVQAVAGVAKYASTFFAYNLFGDLIKSVDPLGNTSKATYDNLGRKLTQTTYQGDWEAGGTALATESFEYGQSGINETFTRHTDVRGGITTVQYTTTGKPRLKTNADGSILEWRYYLDGRLRLEPTGAGSYWEYAYDEAARKMTRTLKDATNLTVGTEETVADCRGNVVSQKDLAGYVTTRTYDKVDRVKTASAPADATYPARSPAQVTTYTYDAAGFQSQASNALGETSITTSDALGRTLTSVVKNAQAQIVSQSATTYSADFNSVTTTVGTVGQGALTSQTWTNTAGQVVIVKNGDGTYQRSQYDAAGQAVAVTDEVGYTTRTAYDALGRVKQTTLPDNAQTNFVYTYTAGGGEQQERLMPGQLAEVVKYNAAGQLIDKYNRGVGGAITRRYQSYVYHTSGAKAGLVQQFADPMSQIHAYTYDNLGLTQTYISGAVGSISRVERTFGYDSAKQHLTSVTEVTGAGVSSVVSHTYAQNGSLLTEKLTLGGTVVRHLENSYDAAGRRTRLAKGTDVSSQGNGAGAQQDFTWRADGLLNSVTANGVAGSFSYTYGTHGLLESRTNAYRTHSINSATGRDARGRLLAAQTTVTGVAGTLLQESMTWENNSRQKSYLGVRAAAGGVVSWSDGRQYLYTPGRQQLNSETYGAGPQGGSKTLIHNYDFNQGAGLGVRTASQISEPTNGVLWNSFVGDGSSGGQDAFSRVTNEYVGSERYNLRAHGRAVGAKDVTLQLNGNTNLGSSDTSLLPADPLGNWQTGDWEKWLHLEPGTYDLKAEATHPSGEKVQSSNVNFTVVGGAVPVGLTYDALGQITQRSVANGQRVQTLTWDAQGRLIKVIQMEVTLSNIGWQWEATYDGMNRRVRTVSTPLINKPQAGGTFTVVADTAKATREDTWYDPFVEFLEVAVEINGVRQWAIHGPDLNGGYGGLQGMGGLEAWVEESTGQSTGMIDDAYGHVVANVKNSVFSWQQTRCAGYGPQALNPIYRVAEGANLAQATAWRGKRQDVTGFYYMGARYYDAQSTRFLSIDPMGHAASMSLYDYAGGDPINFVDPSGRRPGQSDGVTVKFQVNQNWFNKNSDADAIRGNLFSQAYKQINDPQEARSTADRFFYDNILHQRENAIAMSAEEGDRYVADLHEYYNSADFQSKKFGASVVNGVSDFFGLTAVNGDKTDVRVSRNENGVFSSSFRTTTANTAERWESLLSSAPFMMLGGPEIAAEKSLVRSETRVLAAKGGAAYDMALGLARHQETGSAFLLKYFAEKTGAKTYGDIYGSWWPGSMQKLETNISKAMSEADKLRFNLDQFDMNSFHKYLENPGLSNKNITNWELHQTLTNPSLLEKTTFYGSGGTVIRAPLLP